MHATWLTLPVDKQAEASAIVVTWKVDPPIADGWSIALIEAHDTELQNRNVIMRVDCTPPVDGKITATLHIRGALGLPHWALMLYHRATEFDVRVNDVTMEIVNDTGDVSSLSE